MSSNDQFRAEFEAWAKANANELETKFCMREGRFFYEYEADIAFRIYAAGRKAEREAMQRKNDEWSKAVNKAWIETASQREGEL